MKIPSYWECFVSHEALHQNLTAPQREELMASSIDTLTYGQFVEEDPSIAQSGTELSRHIIDLCEDS